MILAAPPGRWPADSPETPEIHPRDWAGQAGLAGSKQPGAPNSTLATPVPGNTGSGKGVPGFVSQSQGQELSAREVVVRTDLDLENSRSEEVKQMINNKNCGQRTPPHLRPCWGLTRSHMSHPPEGDGTGQ